MKLPAFNRQVRACFAATLLLWGAATAGAQEAAAVPPSSDVHRRIEAVSAFFPVPIHRGLRPASVRATTNVLHRLRAAVEASPLDHPRREWALRELALIADELPASGGGIARTAWRLDAWASSAMPARIDSNALGFLDATESSFGGDRRGLPYPRGAAVTALPAALLARGRWALLVEPSIGYVTDSSGTAGRALVRRAYGRLVTGNVSLTLGADDRVWGQAARGSLFLSDNAAPVPAIELGTDTAVTLPWLLRYAGPVRGTLLVGDLGPSQRPRHARLAGWQVNMQPWTRFELGVAVLVQTGGNGAPPATFLERVVDLFPAIDALAPQHADLSFSNKFAGGNLRLRFPELSGLDVYYELAIDDFDGRRLRSSMVDDASHLLGARVAAGEAVVRAEWHRTSIRMYEHTQFVSGATFRRRLLGSPLGPHAAAGYASIEWPLRSGATATITLADERRDPAQYASTVDGDRDRGFRFVRLTDDPDVRRAWAQGTLDGSIGRLGARVRYGLARAWREGGAARTEWVTQVELRSALLPWF